MTAAYRAQLAAIVTGSAPVARTPAKGVPIPLDPVAASTGQRNTPKELPGPRLDTPVRWQVAGGLFAEQFCGCFRMVVTGKESDLPAVLAALTELTR